MILPVVLTLGFLTAVVLVYLQVQFAKMGSHRVASAVERAEKLIEKGKLAQAERMLYRSLRINGWDYEAYLAGKKGNKALNIESVVPGVTRIARMLKVVPGSTLEWVLPAMFTLGDIYKKQGKAKKTSRTFEDALNFIGGYGDDISFANKSRYLSTLHEEQALLEKDLGNFAAAIRLHLTAYIEIIAWFKASGDDRSFGDHYPYDGDEFLDECLRGMQRRRDRQPIIDIVNRAVRNSPGRINPQIMTRDLDAFLAGSRRRDEAELHATRDIIHTALSKAQEKKPEEDEGGETKEKDGVIIL